MEVRDEGGHLVGGDRARFEHADEVELVHHSFPLSSSFPEGDKLAESEGLLPYQVLDNKVGNTDLAPAWTTSWGSPTSSAWTASRPARLSPTAATAGRSATTRLAPSAPFIVVDDRYRVRGAQDSDSFLELLRKAWDDSHPLTPAGDAPVCGPDGCAVPERA